MILSLLERKFLLQAVIYAWIGVGFFAFIGGIKVRMKSDRKEGQVARC